MDAFVQRCAGVRVGVVLVNNHLATGRALMITHVEALSQGGMALWKGGVIRHGVGSGVNISPSETVPSQGRIPRGDVRGCRHLVLTGCDRENNKKEKGENSQ